MRAVQWRIVAIGVAFGGLCLAARSYPEQTPGTPQRVEIPATATTLEGVPTVRIDSAEGSVARHVLTPEEAAKSRLTVGLVNGRYYWTSRGNRPLEPTSSGAFTYLSSDPGHYIRLTRVHDKIAYTEHVDLESGSVTWWGELRIVVVK